MSSRRRVLPTIGAVLAVLGLVLVVVCGVRTAQLVGKPLAQTISSPVRQTPVDDSLTLSKGTYEVFQLTGHTSGGGGVTDTQNRSPTLTPDEVTVIGPDGQRVAVSGDGFGHQNLTRDNTIYTGAASFVAPVPGVYRLRVSTPQPTQIIVGPSLGTGFRKALPWILGLVIAGFVMTLGVVLFFIGLVRRRSLRKTPQFQAGPGGPAQQWPPQQWPPQNQQLQNQQLQNQNWPNQNQNQNQNDQYWQPRQSVPSQQDDQQRQAGVDAGNPSPGWYPDPHPESDPAPEPAPVPGSNAPARTRWWDGSGWTRYVR